MSTTSRRRSSSCMPAWVDRRSSCAELVARPCPGPARSTRTRSRRRRSSASAAGAARRLLARAQQGPLGAVDDVALGDAHVAAEHELLLDDVLHRLDRDVRSAEPAGALVDARRRAAAGGRRSACSDRNALRIATSILRGVPRRDVAGAADQPRRVGRRRQRRGHAVAARAPWRRRTGRPRSGRLDDRREVVDGDPPGVVQPPRDRGGGRADVAAGGGRVGLRARRARARAPTARRRRHRATCAAVSGPSSSSWTSGISTASAAVSVDRRAAPHAAAPPRA